MVFKAQAAVFSRATNEYRLAGTVIINMNNVVSFTPYSVKENEFITVDGKKLWNVETSIHNTGYHLLVVSDYLDRLEEDSL